MSRTLALISSARSESARAALPLDTVLAWFASRPAARASLTIGGLPALLLARWAAPGRARSSRLLPLPGPPSGSAPRGRAAGRGSPSGHGLARRGIRQVGVRRGLLVVLVWLGRGVRVTHVGAVWPAPGRGVRRASGRGAGLAPGSSVCLAVRPAPGRRGPSCLRG